MTVPVLCPALLHHLLSSSQLTSHLTITTDYLLCGVHYYPAPPNMKEPLPFPSCSHTSPHTTSTWSTSSQSTITSSPTSYSAPGVLILTLKTNIIFHHNWKLHTAYTKRTAILGILTSNLTSQFTPGFSKPSTGLGEIQTASILFWRIFLVLSLTGTC